MTSARLWSHLKLIALVMLLTTLLHDVTMAGDPHDVAPEHSATHTGHDHPGSPPPPAPSGGTESASECGSFEKLRPPSAGLDLPGERTLPPDSGSEEASAVASVSRDEEPDHPPDVRRALLQVFLN